VNKKIIRIQIIQLPEDVKEMMINKHISSARHIRPHLACVDSFNLDNTIGEVLVVCIAVEQNRGRMVKILATSHY
jgi:hypothetical protein